MSLALVRYVLTAAVRDRLVLSLTIILVLAASLSVFMGSAAISEKGQFAVTFMAGSLRVSGVFGLILFVVFFIRRSFDARDVEFLLSRPVGRVEFIVSYAAAFSILAILLSFAQALAIYILNPQMFGAGSVFWLLSVMLENIIMVNAALFFAMILSSAAGAAMAAAGLYVLARMMGQLLGIADSGEGGNVFFHALEMIMQIISAVMPRLDLIGQTTWLVYGLGDASHLVMILAHAIIFSVVLVIAAVIDLVRRQF